jgi:hypothetical protein
MIFFRKLINVDACYALSCELHDRRLGVSAPTTCSAFLLPTLAVGYKFDEQTNKMSNAIIVRNYYHIIEHFVSSSSNLYTHPPPAPGAPPPPENEKFFIFVLAYVCFEGSFFAQFGHFLTPQGGGEGGGGGGGEKKVKKMENKSIKRWEIT